MDGIATINFVLSALVGASVAAVGALIQSALSQRVKVDESLRSARLEVYKVLWKKTELLPRWPKADDVTYQKLHDLCADLRHWYFNQERDLPVGGSERRLWNSAG